MLEVSNLSKSFGNVEALKDLNFKAEDGKIFGIIGRNGAGKSTTFRLILKIIEPTNGEILYNGEKINEKILDKIGYLPEEGSLISTYTVLELCEYYGALKLVSPEQIREKLVMWLEEFNIKEFMNRKIKDLSKGNRQKIQFIISVLHNPELLILDEPFSGLDPISVEELKKAILKLKSEGKTMVFVTHSMNTVKEFCDRAIWLYKGKIKMDGKPDDVIDEYLTETL